MKKVILLNITAALFIASLSSTFAVAEDVNADIQTIKVMPSNVEVTTFDSLDTDKDGFISPEEVNAGSDETLKSAFSKMDTNQDNLLSRDEFEQAINNL